MGGEGGIGRGRRDRGGEGGIGGGEGRIWEGKEG